MKGDVKLTEQMFQVYKIFLRPNKKKENFSSTKIILFFVVEIIKYG
jgi:hypothetical protein